MVDTLKAKDIKEIAKKPVAEQKDAILSALEKQPIYFYPWDLNDCIRDKKTKTLTAADKNLISMI